MKKIKTSFNLLKAYFYMIIVFTLLSVISCLIPHKYIDTNIRKSMEYLSEEGRFPCTFGNILWARDNITDGTMYNISVSGYGLNPFEECMINLRTITDNDSIHSATYGLMALNKQNDSVERKSYGRYWHGYQVPLRISSMFITIRGQRIFHSIFIFFLLCISSVMIKKEFGNYVSIIWIVTFVLLGIIAVPLSLQYVACYYIMFLSVIALLRWPSLMHNLMFFFIIGGFTSYMDFLTIPLITILIPASIIILQNYNLLSYKTLFSIISTWLIGYCSIWSSKWILQSLFFGYNALTNAIGAGGAHFILTFLPDGITHKFFIITCIFLSLALLTCITIYVLKKNKTKSIKQLFIIALIPFLWYFVFLGHNTMHIWFTYRSLTTTVFCSLLIIFSNKIKLYKNEHSNSNSLL